MARKPKSQLPTVLTFIKQERLKSIRSNADGSFELELFPDVAPVLNNPWRDALPNSEVELKRAEQEMSIEQMEMLYDELLLADPMEAERLRLEILKKEGMQ